MIRQRLRALLAVFSACILVSGCPANLADNVEQAGPISGPFAVSRFYTPSGYMGDGDNPGFLLADVNDQCLPRPDGARGNCYRFQYREDNRCPPFGDCRWAGVYWVFPANNWGSRPGRSIGFSFTRATFYAAAKYQIVLPKGGRERGICRSDADCRTGLRCSGGACASAGQTAKDSACLISAECAAGLQCAGQLCTLAGTGAKGSACPGGLDELCAVGLRCGQSGVQLQCEDDGAGDLGSMCLSRNDCHAGLQCDQGACLPATRLSAITFQVGLVPLQPQFQAHKDQNQVQYAPGPNDPSTLTLDYQKFSIDLSMAGRFDSLLGAFMWAMAFPNGNEVAAAGAPQAYKADVTKPVEIYLDDIFIE
jgi:hypothetical protein